MSRVTTIVILLAVSISVAGATAAQAATCDAQADVELTTREVQDGGNEKLSFEVEVQLEGQCGEVYYALILTIDPGGDPEEVRIDRQVNLHDYNTTQKVLHTLPEGHSLVDYRTEITRCVPCDPEE